MISTIWYLHKEHAVSIIPIILWPIDRSSPCIGLFFFLKLNLSLITLACGNPSSPWLGWTFCSNMQWLECVTLRLVRRCLLRCKYDSSKPLLLNTKTTSTFDVPIYKNQKLSSHTFLRNCPTVFRGWDLVRIPQGSSITGVMRSTTLIWKDRRSWWGQFGKRTARHLSRLPRAEEPGRVPTRTGSDVVPSLEVRSVPAWSPVGCFAGGWP